MYICICKAVTDEQLEQLMAQGCRNIRDLQRKCKVGADCGCCLQYVRDMISSQDPTREDHQNNSTTKD